MLQETGRTLVLQLPHLADPEDELGRALASLVAQLVENLPAMQETLVGFLVGKIPWRRARLPTPAFLGFPGGSDGKDSACNVGDLGSITGLGSPWRREWATHSNILAWRVCGLRCLAGYSP